MSTSESPNPSSRPFSVVLQASMDDAPQLDANVEGDNGWSQDDLFAEYQRVVEASDQVELISELTFDALGASPDLSFEAGGESAAALAQVTTSADSSNTPPASSDPAASLSQVLEALVFVGGTTLTPRRLGEVVGCSADQVHELLTDLGRRYRDEGRPYDIQFTEGGYRISLTSDFETVRERVFGHRPREVRLAPDALEVLALIAYQQPLTKEQLAETDKEDIDSIVRQLIRRDLVALDRGDDGKSIRYRTTPRLLEVFGLRSLNDLPRADDVRFK
jgi:segregation and condensation protein B